MLKFIRQGQESLFIKLLLLAIAASFFVGFLVLPAARRGSADDIVAVVDGENIYRRDVVNAVLDLRQRYRDQLGDAYEGLKDYFEDRLPQQAYDQVIERRAMESYARRVGFDTSPEELRRIITTNPNFQVDGRFSPKQYRRFLERARTTDTEFEFNMARDIALQKFQGFLSAQVKVSEAELEQRYLDENTKVELEVFFIDPKDLAEKVNVADEEIRAYYDEHTADFFQPETRDVVYLVYNGAGAPFLGLPEVNEVSAADIEKYYAENRGKYTLSEKNWRVQDILLSTRATGDDDKRSEERRKQDAKKRADEAFKLLEAGKPFGEVANEFSDDLATKRTQNGGVLAGGYITAGYFKPEVREKFMELGEGQRSTVFEASDGYHIVQVAKVYEPGSVKPLADVSDLIRTTIRQERAHEAARKQAQKDADEAGGKSLRDLALADPENRRLEIATVAQDGVLPRVGKDEAMLQAIFTEMTPESKPRLFQAGKQWVLVEVEKTNEPAPSPLEKVKGEVLEILKKERTVAAAKALAGEIRGKLVAGTSPAKLGKDYKSLTVEDTPAFNRIGRESSAGVSGVDVIPEVGQSAALKAAAFALTSENPVTPDVYDVGGKIAFARLKKRVGPDRAGFGAARDALELRVRRERQQALLGEWATKAKESVEVEVVVPVEQFKEYIPPAT